MQQGKFKFGDVVRVTVPGFYLHARGVVCARSNAGQYLVKLFAKEMPSGYERTFTESELELPPAEPLSPTPQDNGEELPPEE